MIFLDFRFDIFMRMERLSFMSDDGNCFVIFDETDVSIPIFKSFSSPLKIKYISVNIKIGARNISASVRLSRNISF